MPNWCDNKLIVKGETKRIKAFRESAADNNNDLSLDKLHPMPQELEGTVSPSDKPNWYDWRVSNWGTKWDVEGVLEKESDGYLEYTFFSAWSPPLAWLVKVAKDYSNLEFELEYEEEGNELMGTALAKQGIVEIL